MTKRLLSIATLIFAFGGSVSIAQTSPTTRHSERLLLVLRLIDQVPTKDQLLAAGAGQNGEALLNIANDRTLKRYPRMRAAGLLAHFDSRQNRSALRRLVETSDDVEVRLQALVGLTHLEGANTEAFLVPLLDHANPHLRAGAARGLVRIKAVNRHAVLTARIQKESVPWVRSALSRALRNK